MEETIGQKQRALKMLITTLLIVLLIILVIISCRLNVEVPCALHSITGINCPGCGTTRMVKALLDGNVYQAVRYNIVAFITMPIAVVLYIMQSYLYVKYNEISSWFFKLLIMYTGILVMFGVIRNIEPFIFLLPTVI